MKMKKQFKSIFAITLLMISVFTIWSCAGGFKKSKENSFSIEGTWQGASYKYGFSQSKFNDFSRTQSRIKLITDTYFTWVTTDSVSKKVYSVGGGKYSLRGDTLTEWIDYGLGMDAYLGHKQTFIVKVEGDMLFLSGFLSDSLKIEEIWRKVSVSGNTTGTISSQPVPGREVKGDVLKGDGSYFSTVPIVVTGTSSRPASDTSGKFLITNVPEKSFLVFSYRGYKTQVLKPDFSSPMTVKMEKDPYYKESSMVFRFTQSNRPEQLVVVDGVVSDKSYLLLADELGYELGIVKNLAGAEALKKFGEKAKNGVIEITTRKKALAMGLKPPFRRLKAEDFPTFQGKKSSAFNEWLISQIKYPSEAKAKSIEGRVNINMNVELNGSLSGLKTVSSPDPLLTEGVLKVIQSSPQWDAPKNPAVDESFAESVSIKFSLPDKVSDGSAFVAVDQMPIFPGGDAELLKFIAENTKYPAEAKEKNIQGRVIVRFIINSEGKPEDVVILKGVNPLLDAEAIRSIRLLPAFAPGYQGGKPVDVYYMVPVNFTLQ
ncbi:MAG TPA: TonB family protein [Bacteroidales bacterium]